MSGVRSLFKLYMVKHDIDEDIAWYYLRIELTKRITNIEEWELQTLRAVLYEEHNLTQREGVRWCKRFKGQTPLIDSLQALLTTPINVP